MPATLRCARPGASASLPSRSRRTTVTVTASHPSPVAVRLASAAASAALTASLLLGASPAALAVGLESVDLVPSSLEASPEVAEGKDVIRKKLAAEDEAFLQSNTLKELLKKSEANKEKNKRDIQNKYCFRQAELGVGDCGGLRFIPGLTENGKQKTPDWLNSLLGVEAPPEGSPAANDVTGGKTLKELIYDRTADE
ncbi:hypothetical protein HYH03_011814 [Edaphochlamys debaryana]|uniref:Uncharacterized protein n=1 Tax=Edaphochlamys debaryana TaxID=47281 RepID=A0A835XRA7_9CHLO|nr:hypothetical protein HYH03_011814 [Edaphochlamys debaryana]|eukprot:KAG2489707.1 hypothetical protein HYH03_011814 [Edaphochlamys debaryana]